MATKTAVSTYFPKVRSFSHKQVKILINKFKKKNLTNIASVTYWHAINVNDAKVIPNMNLITLHIPVVFSPIWWLVFHA